MAVTKLITPTWLKNNFLVGIDLTDDNNDPFPDEHYLYAIDNAVSMMEATYNITIRRPRTNTWEKRYAGTNQSSRSWHMLFLDDTPLTEVTEFAVQFGNYDASTLPLSWVHIISKPAAQIQIIPGPEGFKHPLVIGNAPIFSAGILDQIGYIPNWLRVKYRSGFEKLLAGTVSGTSGANTVTYSPSSAGESLEDELQEGDHVRVDSSFYRVADVLSPTSFEVTGTLPENWSSLAVEAYTYDPSILQAIGLLAAIPILDTAGDLILGAGISSTSLSVDGLSQSVSSTAGVENSGYGARISQYNKRLVAIHQYLMRKYRRLQVMVV